MIIKIKSSAYSRNDFDFSVVISGIKWIFGVSNTVDGKIQSSIFEVSRNDNTQWNIEVNIRENGRQQYP